MGAQRARPCSLISVALDGADAMHAVDRDTRVFMNEVTRVSPGEFAEWAMLRQLHLRGLASSEEQADLGHLTGMIQQDLAGKQHSFLRLLPGKLEVEEGRSYHLSVSIRCQSSDVTFTTTLAARSLPVDGNWSPAEIHIHSTWSDGILTPEEHKLNFASAGYRIFYFNDHVSSLRPPGQPTLWDSYRQQLEQLSGGNQYLYAGTEVTSTSPTGDSIALGIGHLGDLYDSLYYPQTVIDKVNTSCGGTVPMAAVAHPYSSFIPWTAWTVTNYHGYEIISGYQSSLGNTSNEANRWRTELYRLIDQAVAGSGRFPATLASTDYHRLSHPGQVTWIGTPNYQSKTTVDQAIRDGKTVASKKGGLAYFVLTANGQTSGIGEKRRNIAPNTALTATVTVKPVATGTYSIYLYRGTSSADATAVQVWSRLNQSYVAGQTYQYVSQSLPTNAFPGGRHAYYVHVVSTGVGEYIYTSPIFLSTD